MSSSFRIPKFISAWNIFVSNVLIHKHEIPLQIHPFQHTFLTELNTEFYNTNPGKSSSTISEALQMCNRHTYSIGLLAAVDGIKRDPWAVDSVKALLHGVSSAHESCTDSESSSSSKPSDFEVNNTDRLTLFIFIVELKLYFYPSTGRHQISHGNYASHEGRRYFTKTEWERISKTSDSCINHTS